MSFKNILILTAMENEFSDCTKDKTIQSSMITKFNINSSILKENGKSFIFAQTGVGPINASLTSSLLIESYPIDLVVLLGLGGALDSSLNLGDICIADNIIQHDAICAYDDKTEQMACGELHLSVPASQRANIKIEASRSINEKVSEYLKESGFKVKSGDIVSGSEFSAGINRKLSLKERFPDATMVEMESSAIAFVAKKANIPFIVVKTVADTINSTPSDEYTNFIQSNQKKCVDIFNCLVDL